MSFERAAWCWEFVIYGGGRSAQLRATSPFRSFALPGWSRLRVPIPPPVPRLVAPCYESRTVKQRAPAACRAVGDSLKHAWFSVLGQMNWGPARFVVVSRHPPAVISLVFLPIPKGVLRRNVDKIVCPNALRDDFFFRGRFPSGRPCGRWRGPGAHDFARTIATRPGEIGTSSGGQLWFRL